MPPSFSSFLWGRLLEHSSLEHFCLDQFSVIQGKICMQRFSNTSFGRTLLGSNFGGLLLKFPRTNFLSALCGLPTVSPDRGCPPEVFLGHVLATFPGSCRGVGGLKKSEGDAHHRCVLITVYRRGRGTRTGPLAS